MSASWKVVPVAAALMALWPLSGCTSKTGNPTGAAGPGGPGKAFLDQKKEVPPRKEWTREVVSRGGGTFTFRVASQGPFAVTVITDKGYKALQGGDRNPVAKEDVLLTVDSKEPTLEKSITVPAGSSWFIIENQTDKNVEIHLQCFAP
jgi:hypothetical protein